MTKLLHLLLADPPFEERPSINPRRDVPLEEYLIWGVRSLLALEEMVERHLVKGGGRGIRRNMPPNARAFAVGANDHRHGVPTDQTLDLPLDFPIARIGGFLVGGDRVYVGRGRAGHIANPPIERRFLHPIEQKRRAFRSG